MEIGREWDSVWKNQWPRENDVPGFKADMLSFFQVCPLASQEWQPFGHQIVAEWAWYLPALAQLNKEMMPKDRGYPPCSHQVGWSIYRRVSVSQTCHDLHTVVLQSIALGLKLEENYFDKLVRRVCRQPSLQTNKLLPG